LPEGMDERSAEQAQHEPSGNDVALHNLKSNVDSFSVQNTPFGAATARQRSRGLAANP
jgi:hypothetical protein